MTNQHVVAYVEWTDSGVLSATWTDRDDVLGQALRDTQDPIRSAGLLIHEDDAGIVLALASNDTHDELGSAWWIPRVNIRRLDKWLPTAETP